MFRYLAAKSLIFSYVIEIVYQSHEYVQKTSLANRFDVGIEISLEYNDK